MKSISFYLIAILSVLFMPLNSYSQLKANAQETKAKAQEFSTKFYITNDVGMKDSLVIGYSATATFGVDVEYGETALVSPISNNAPGSFILIDDGGEKFSKVQIVPNSTGWVKNNAIAIVVPYESLPVKVSWDKSLFENAERNYSLITDWTLGGWFDAGTYTFKENLRDASEIEIKDVEANFVFNDNTNNHLMYRFYIAFADFSNIVASNKNQRILSEIELYPNPAKDILIVKSISPNKTPVFIYDFQGRLKEKHWMDESEVKIDISDYHNGIYFVRIDSRCFKFSKE